MIREFIALRHYTSSRMSAGFEAWIVSKEDLIQGLLAGVEDEAYLCPMLDTTPEFRRLLEQQFLRLERRRRLCERLYGSLAQKAFGPSD
ncbi:MAG TPA: hypothetical protein VML57_00980 [Burkholderiales bacterium]|nr:hypothetical protein [Burkholderiales bacterium]